MNHPFSHFFVYGNSMYPTLRVEQHVLTFNWFYKVKLNDVIVAEVNNRFIIKRITKIKNDWIFLKGDNIKESTDSRSFGWINKNQVIGKIIFSI